MTESRMDVARLAALLDGRLDADERAGVLAEVASSDEAYDVFVDAMMVLPAVQDRGDAVEGELGERGEPSPRGRHRVWRVPSRQWLALAAAVVVLAALSWFWGAARSASRHDPARFVARLDVRQTGLPQGWNGRPWSSTRGVGGALTGPGRAVRLGAHLVDLDLATRTRDPRAGPIAAEIAVLLEDVPAGSPAAAIYRDLSRRVGAPRDSLADLLARGRVAAAALAGSDLVELGAWVETARLAAARNDLRFFHTRVSGDLLERAARLPDLAPSARAALDRVRPMVHSGAPEWTRLERDLTTLLAALAE